MKVARLNHINIRTMKMEETKDFYVEKLGLEVGFRPPFDEHGYWLYAGDVAIVHLSYSRAGEPPRTHAGSMGDGLDHIGLDAEGFDDMLDHLRRTGTRYNKRLVGGGTIAQIFFHDPNGVLVELAYDVAGEGIDPETFEEEMEAVLQ